MTKLRRLKMEARKSAEERGHRLTRFVHYGLLGSIIANVQCKKCGKYASVTERPRANEIDIGGQAVALNCRGKQ